MRGRVYIVSMTTQDAQNSTASTIRAARDAQHMTMREFGAALGVSHNMVMLWEEGKNTPDRSRVAAWIADERDWVHLLGLRMFGLQYRALIQNVLVPA